MYSTFGFLRRVCSRKYFTSRRLSSSGGSAMPPMARMWRFFNSACLSGASAHARDDGRRDPGRVSAILSRVLNALSFRVLRRLSDGEFHSGAALARELEVSRGTVWNVVRAF